MKEERGRDVLLGLEIKRASELETICVGWAYKVCSKSFQNKRAWNSFALNEFIRSDTNSRIQWFSSHINYLQRKCFVYFILTGFNYLHRTLIRVDAHEPRTHSPLIFAVECTVYPTHISMICIGPHGCPTQMMHHYTSVPVYLLYDAIQETQFRRRKSTFFY